MRRIQFGILISLIAILAASANAQSVGHLYARFDAGFSSATDPGLEVPTSLPADLGHSLSFGVGAGYRFHRNIRADFTLSYRGGFEQQSGFSDQPKGVADFRSFSGLISGYYDRRYADRWTPYAGAGIGFSQNKLGTIFITNLDGSPLATIASGTKTGFAWHLAAGTGFDLTDSLILDVGYHYFHGNGYESGGSIIFADGHVSSAKNNGHLNANEFQVGIRWCL